MKTITVKKTQSCGPTTFLTNPQIGFGCVPVLGVPEGCGVKSVVMSPTEFLTVNLTRGNRSEQWEADWGVDADGKHTGAIKLLHRRCARRIVFAQWMKRKAIRFFRL